MKTSDAVGGRFYAYGILPTPRTHHVGDPGKKFSEELLPKRKKPSVSDESESGTGRPSSTETGKGRFVDILA